MTPLRAVLSFSLTCSSSTLVCSPQMRWPWGQDCFGCQEPHELPCPVLYCVAPKYRLSSLAPVLSSSPWSASILSLAPSNPASLLGLFPQDPLNPLRLQTSPPVLHCRHTEFNAVSSHDVPLNLSDCCVKETANPPSRHDSIGPQSPRKPTKRSWERPETTNILEMDLAFYELT